VAAAAAADVAVVVVGLDHDTETEGRDRTTLALPSEQDDLVRAVAAVNERTVVVVNAGAPVLMPWRDEVAAVVQMWYPGMEGGHALADVLSGDVNPSGRLPTTFPAELSDTAAHYAGNPAHYPGVGGQVHYDEGVFIGYRWFDARDLTPQWCFGHGLSYTRFEYRDVELNVVAPLSAGVLSHDERPGGEPVIEVSVTVVNVGDRDGHEVVQVYVAPPVGDLARPRRELRGFARVFVPAGGQVRVSVPLDRRALAAWDPDAQGWVVAAGTHHVEVGASSRDLRASASFDVAP
jgi:beta-glucosidase